LATLLPLSLAVRRAEFSQEHALARSVGLTTAETSEAFPLAVVVSMAAVDAIGDCTYGMRNLSKVQKMEKNIIAAQGFDCF
jgi:hypothetical protein